MAKKSAMSKTINQVGKEMIKDQKKKKSEELKQLKEIEKENKRAEKEALQRDKEYAINYAKSVTEKVCNEREEILSLLSNINDKSNYHNIKWNGSMSIF